MSRRASAREMLDRAQAIGIEDSITGAFAGELRIRVKNAEIQLFESGTVAIGVDEGTHLWIKRDDEDLKRVGRAIAAWIEGAS